MGCDGCDGGCWDSGSGTKLDEQTDQKVKFMPRWHVILLNTDVHTFEYVITLIMDIFKKDADEAVNCTLKIHKEGQCIVETTHKERAEMLKEQVETYGADPNMKGEPHTLPCVIEPVPED
jgi:ATP-dependent Clp protease adaptor protein ClpS